MGLLPDDLVAAVVLSCVVVVTGALAWACVLLTRLTRATSAALEESRVARREASEALRSLPLLARSVARYVEDATVERQEAQSRRVALHVGQAYAGAPAEGLPGAVVVQVFNTSPDFLYAVRVVYEPDDPAERQVRLVSQLAPQSSVDLSFRLVSARVWDEEVSMIYTDSRGRTWRRFAGAPSADPRWIGAVPPQETT
ncbi:hypothetical protein [Micromonospora sp. NPDC051141]|uniref:hypothetical protein n=1 Tax=Micromonospora sp. NPDC051141 TaxID=3364284 RepID=UPI00379537D2